MKEQTDLYSCEKKTQLNLLVSTLACSATDLSSKFSSLILLKI